MRKTVFIFFIHFVLVLTVYSQTLNNSVKISNINIKYDGKNIAVYYDLENSKETDEYFVNLEFTDRKGKRIAAKSFTGDVFVIKGGLQKKAWWDFKKDSIFLNDDIRVKIKITPEPKIPLSKHLLKSAVFPGWGDYKLRDKKQYWTIGAVGFGAIATSTIFNYQAAATYDKYNTTTNLSEINTLFNKSVSQKNLSYVFAGAAATIWAIDLACILWKYHKLKKHTVPIEKNYYYQQVEPSSILAISDEMHINTKEAIKPPYLKIHQTNVAFNDKDGNNCLNTNEPALIKFEVANIGSGDATNLVAVVKLKNPVKGLEFSKETSIGSILINQTKWIEIPLSGTMDLETTTANFEIFIKEPNDYNSNTLEINVPTHEFIKPEIIIADKIFSTKEGGKAVKGEILNLKAIIQNAGQGIAYKIIVTFNLPQNVTETGDRYFYIDTLKPNEKKEINFPFVVKTVFKENIVPVSIFVEESYGKYAISPYEYTLELDKDYDKTQLEVKSNLQKTNIEIASLSSDIDKNITENTSKNQNRYALIIGNEDYKKYQTTLADEANVLFARNDAVTFKEYCVKTLGIIDENINFLADATAGRMLQAFDKMSKIINNSNGKAEIFVYYAGHGLPDEKTKEAYLIPVDVNGSNLESAVKLNTVYDKLSQNPAKRITVFLDACFTGGGRNQGLISARGIKIKPKENLIKGNMIVFTASSGEQSALPYKDKNHGMFTYFLLKKLQDSKANISYKELSEYLKEKVSLKSVNINNQEQIPQTNVSEDLKEEWKEWNLKP